jgi:hypothetical protein
LRVEKTPAKGKSAGRPLLPPLVIYLLRLAGVQNADTNGGLRVIKTKGEEAVRAIENNRQFTGFPRAILVPHALREDPGMPSAHNGFSRRSEAEAEGCAARSAMFN